MPSYPIDPFKAARKNAHIWHGENATIWYNEKLDGSFSILVLYDFGDRRRRLFIELNDKNQKIGFKNDELTEEHNAELLQEIFLVEKHLEENRGGGNSLPF